MIICSTHKKEKAPVLPALTDMQGKNFDAETLKGKVYILSYFQTWCGDCVKEQPQLQKLQDRFGADKLQILMVSDEPAEKIAAFRTRFASGLDFYHTDVALKGPEIGVKAYPTTYLISKKGKVEEVKVEGINWYTDDMIALIEKLL
jgi:thiol-disulfide isomerase/thioredoxin